LPASFLMWWIYQRRMCEIAEGRREFPDVSAVPAH
jgi:hypothetical protein